VIPWFQFTTLHIGFITIYVWGLFVAFGILMATWVAANRCEQHKLDHHRLWDLSFWSILGALIGARLFDVVYSPMYFFYHPIELLFLWDGGMSMMGGLIGAVAVGIWYLRKHKLPILPYLDQGFFALPLGIGIGRLGCFLIHDHPGVFTNLFFGVRYPDGVRLDHGLLLSLEGFFLFGLFLFLDRKQHVRPGTFLVWFLMIDGLTRLILDFYRIGDTTFFGLTPAQYAAMIMVVIALSLKRLFIPKN